jgi:hypothetical protein
MSKYKLSELIAKANNNSNSTVVSTGASKYSVAIVNNINGKRVTISKALSSDLSLNSSAYFLPVEETGQLLISSVPIGDRSSCCSLSGADKKVCYNASLVKMLTDAFKLDFSDKTSMAFTDIYIDKSTANPVAIVNMVIIASVNNPSNNL